MTDSLQINEVTDLVVPASCLGAIGLRATKAGKLMSVSVIPDLNV